MAIRLPTILKDFSLGEVSKAVFSRMGGDTPRSVTPSGTVIQHVQLLALSDIEHFARICKVSHPNVKRCSVYCEMMESSAEFRITQIMLDENNRAVRLPTEHEIAGRIVCAEKMDSRLHSMTKGVLPCEFCFPVA